MSVTNSECLAQYSIVNHGLVPSTLYVNPTLFSIPCRFIGGLEICNVAVIVTYQVIVHPKSITHEDISSQVTC
jgi:hypothetical protein